MKKKPTIPRKKPAKSSKINYSKTQFHAGLHPERENVRVFHTDLDGKWWCGWHLTGFSSEQLLAFARSVEADILRLYPDLK